MDCKLENVTIEADYTSNVHVALLDSIDFQQADLGRDQQETLKQAE